MSDGELNLELEPTPSRYPWVNPAISVMMPLDIANDTILWFPESTMRRESLSGVGTRPLGWDSEDAAVPIGCTVTTARLDRVKTATRPSKLSVTYTLVPST
eukprot:CAMPEP_0173411060 /NCGR_PEP_ID=MMETSP1356-20130122/76061_1 /TAXON_ID=77927 ORGANISM="Hemiselmis virescens, Strain PCC157" /NCGR_SAMPLE_ID=MMETSP1356 /ASSEMBLY_ACC=CAM_ASM_000847 /LENGTH=100 /DNA_ID=CAMNT_0014372761 /DNA_START=1228 /DNA_END=1527 /DNA_ORIENTATION=+